MARKKLGRELHVVFDTNPLYTVVASDLVSNEVSQIIRKNAQHIDLTIHWYIPEIVVEERKFQMRQRAAELVPSLIKVEKLLGHNLNITEDILESRVNDGVSRSLQDLKIKTIKLDTRSVDWEKIIENSVKRQPPFERGDKEKGFRDAMAGESFFQLASQLPNSPTRCILAFVTEDKLLTEFVRSRLNSTNGSNGRILSGLEEVKNLINTLVSEVDELFVSEFREKAGAMFFTGSDNKEALYYKEKIYDRIKSDFASELKILPEDAESMESEGITIGQAQFVKKQAQRVFWATRINFSFKAYRREQRNDEQRQSSLVIPSVLSKAEPGTLLTNWFREQEKVHVASGKMIFQVNWSTVVGQHRKLTSAKIESIDFVDANWAKV